jgi:hypothetical protein
MKRCASCKFWLWIDGYMGACSKQEAISLRTAYDHGTECDDHDAREEGK